MSESESASLIDRVRAGERTAMEALLDRHLPALRAFIRLRVGPMLRAKESVSDLVQSVCREVLGDLDRFQYGTEAGFKAWLYSAALRKVADRADHWQAGRRDAAREVPIGPLGNGAQASDAGLIDVYRTITTPSKIAMAAEAARRMEEAFDHLTADQREIIVLSRIAGLSHAEIAQRMGRSEPATRSLLYRALTELGERLGTP